MDIKVIVKDEEFHPKNTGVYIAGAVTIDADYETAAAAVDAGVRSTTHLFNAMSPMSHRSPGVVGAALTKDVYAELIADTYHVDKALFPLVAKAKGDKLIIVTD